VTGGKEETLYGEQLSAGALVDGYAVERVHYRGPMATLYRARALRTGAPVALKVLHAQPAGAHATLRRFHREAATLQRLRHPHVVEIVGYGELPDGRPYIAMEWLEGRDLGAELAARGPFSPREALEVLEPVGAALRAAHEAGIIHRDLKPQNVVVRPGGGVTLVDFGIARPLRNEEGVSSLTHTGMVLGTPLSMAPEQIRGEPPDVRTDVYGFGVLLYQLLTGRPPYEGTTRHEVEEQHLYAPPPRVSDRAPVPATLDAVVRRCLEKHREARYPTLDAVLEELGRAVREAGTSGPQPVLAVALYVEARVVGEPDPVSLGLLDALLERAGEAARGAGLETVVDGAGCLLAAAALPEDVDAARAARLRVLEAALTLLASTGEGPATRVSLSLTVHVDSAMPCRDAGGRPGLSGGGLLRVSDWTRAHPAQGLVASDAALPGGELPLRTQPLSGAPGFWLILRPGA